MIEARGLRFAYDDGPTVLHGIDLEVAGEAVLALMGPNGAGKTTLLKVLAGLYEPTGGDLRMEGVVGFAPEDPDDALFAETVQREVAFFPDNRGLPVDEHVGAALETMGVADLADRVPQTLSAGAKRRVSIAAVLAGDPAVVALDEPTSGLDVPHVETLGRHLRSLDRPVVLATHDADFALRWADRVAIVTDGRIVRRGETTAILGDPATDFAAAGVRPPGPVELARAQGWSRVPRTVAEAASWLDEGVPSP